MRGDHTHPDLIATGLSETDLSGRTDRRIGFQGAETLLTECDLGEAAGRFIDGGQNNQIPADLTRVAAAAQACTPDR